MTTFVPPAPATESRIPDPPHRPAIRRSPLELSPQEMRELAHLAVERVVEHVASLPEQPASDYGGAVDVAGSLIEPMPRAGEPPERILDRLFREIVPKGINTASPGFLGYVPSGGLFHAAVADLIANGINRYVASWHAAPGLAQIESTVVRWFCDMVGFPERAGGFLASGGSIANLSAIAMARSELLGEDFQRGTLYLADQAHHSNEKAARLAGLSRDNLRRVPVDGRFRICIDELRRRIRNDRNDGMRPFLVIGSVGTTNTGAVDDLQALADLAEEEGLWLHLDAAYGGFFVLTERGRRRMRGIERADSITLDPHKGLFLPYGTGCLLARDRCALERTHRVDAAYLPDREYGAEPVSFCDISPELSRDFRGLRVWLPLRMHGVGAFRDALDEKLDLAAWAAEELDRHPELEIVARPQLSTLAFRLARPGLGRDELDRANRALLEAVNARQRVFLSGTHLDTGFVLRLNVLGRRTPVDRLQRGLEDIRASAREVLSSLGGPARRPGGGPGRRP
ncbi:MAG: pyridoxal-dependent decarboxylase [Holophagales bacterium]|nr:pyridoxal-dependent decarboxylase [Holophagales bacterium]